MPNVKIRKRKSRNLKPKSVGMTEISVDRLRKVVEMEKHIEDLKGRLDNPDYHDLGKPHHFDIPLTDRLNIDNLHHEQLLTRVEQAEIGNIFTFFIGITMTIFFLTTTLLLTFWP